MKYMLSLLYKKRRRRSRKGAWIEMLRQAFMLQRYYVAPVRERGLKCFSVCVCKYLAARRSRKGAWIEILSTVLTDTFSSGRSRKGAWIEICAAAAAWRKPFVAPVRERGLKY